MLEHQSIGKRSLNSLLYLSVKRLAWKLAGRCDESLKCFVLAEAVVRTGEGLPDHSRSEAVLLALLDLVNDVLKIPGGPRKPGQLDLNRLNRIWTWLVQPRSNIIWKTIPRAVRPYQKGLVKRGWS